MKKVLVVEDYKPLVDLYEAWLREEYEVIRAYNGEEAVLKYRQEKPDLVVMDIRMPKKDGASAIKDIYQEDPDASIFVATAFGYTEDEVGATVINKTFGKKKFMEMVEKGIRGELRGRPMKAASP